MFQQRRTRTYSRRVYCRRLRDRGFDRTVGFMTRSIREGGCQDRNMNDWAG
jgi:hypothetical protein